MELYISSIDCRSRLVPLGDAEKNRDKMQLHQNTRAWVEQQLFSIGG